MTIPWKRSLAGGLFLSGCTIAAAAQQFGSFGPLWLDISAFFMAFLLAGEGVWLWQQAGTATEAKV